MRQGILVNMWVFPFLSLHEHDGGLHISVPGATKQQDLTSKPYSRGCIGGINTGYVGSLDSWIGIRDIGLGEYGN